jgi:hypothetical protein
MQMNFVFVMFYLELIPRRKRFARRLGNSFINPEKGWSRAGVKRQSERDGGKERHYLSKSFEIYSDPTPKNLPWMQCAKAIPVA